MGECRRWMLVTTLSLAALLPAACGAPDPTRRSQEELARLAFEALTRNEVEILEAAMPTGDDLRWTLTRAEGTPPPAVRDDADAFARASREKAAEGFRSSRERAKDVDWSAATYGGTEPLLNRVHRSTGVPTAAVHFHMSTDAGRRIVALERCFEGPGGWVFAGGLVVYPVGYDAENVFLARKTRTDLARLVKAVRAWHRLAGSLPPDLEALTSRTLHGGRPLLEKIPRDVWGRPYLYRPEPEGGFRILSRGLDGEEGTGDDLELGESAPAEGPKREDEG